MAPPSPFGRGMGSSHHIWYSDDSGRHEVRDAVCPACDRTFLIHADQVDEAVGVGGEIHVRNANEWVLHPRVPSRRAPSEVPEPYASLYDEAALILRDSPRASAILSRRALEQLLRSVAGVPKQRNLYEEIEWAIENVTLPSHITETMHEPRIVGNMGAHPTEDETGALIEVVEGEAEWMLDILDALFDFYFVAPAKTAARRAARERRAGTRDTGASNSS